MKLVGAGQQAVRHILYDASGTITTGGTAQLVLARSQARSFLKIQNLSNGPQWFEFGGPRGLAVMSGGAVASVTITNAGFNYSFPPVIRFEGGGGPDGGVNNTTYLGLGQPGGPSPSKPAQASCVMTGSAPNQTLSSVLVSSGGAKYACAPYVLMENSRFDPNGCAVPSAGVGMMLAAQSPPYILNGTCCTTDPIAVFGATTGQGFLCKWMD